jgi:uncharacterized protein YjiS (DUF1127 family)
MPAILTLTISASAALVQATATLAVKAGRGLKRFAMRVKNRHDTMRLAALDDRMLRDIGLNRSDLRDAFAELPWRDPSEVLARRAAERRPQRLRDFPRRRPSALFPPRAPRCYPPTDRQARTLV